MRKPEGMVRTFAIVTPEVVYCGHGRLADRSEGDSQCVLVSRYASCSLPCCPRSLSRPIRAAKMALREGSCDRTS